MKKYQEDTTLNSRKPSFVNLGVAVHWFDRVKNCGVVTQVPPFTVAVRNEKPLPEKKSPMTQLTFHHYQQQARKTAVYPNQGKNLTYPILGLAGETGEVADHVKKIFRDDNGIVTPQRKKALVKELGDVLWYLAAICNELNVTLETVAKTNLKKLQSRKIRGTLHGKGDNR